MDQTVSITRCSIGRNIAGKLWFLASQNLKLQVTIAILKKIMSEKNKGEGRDKKIPFESFQSGILEKKERKVKQLHPYSASCLIQFQPDPGWH